MLRHDPDRHFLSVDSEGWCAIEYVVLALRYHRRGWPGFGPADLKQLITSDQSERFEISGDRIRACYGHSIAWFVGPSPTCPPPILYHGTCPDSIPGIEAEGLLRQRRTYVHLTSDLEYARWAAPAGHWHRIVIEIDAAKAHAAGIRFRQANRHVWLVEALPPEFLR